MNKKSANGTFTIKGWDEKPYNETEGGPKMTRASIKMEYKGDIEGEGALEYLMVYPEENKAYFVGLERIVGSVGGRKGSYVVQHEGTFEGGIAKDKSTVVDGSGTGELAGLKGQGSYETGHEEPHNISFDYHFD